MISGSPSVVKHQVPSTTPGTRHPAPGTSIVYFDGVCGLCNRFVDFLLRHDHRHQFRYAPLQGETAAARLGVRPGSAPRSIVLEDDEGIWERSRAVLRILGRLGGVWTTTRIMGLLPAGFRDWVYDRIAERRYAWFGQRQSCRLPTPAEQERFLP